MLVRCQSCSHLVFCHAGHHLNIFHFSQKIHHCLMEIYYHLLLLLYHSQRFECYCHHHLILFLQNYYPSFHFLKSLIHLHLNNLPLFLQTHHGYLLYRYHFGFLLHYPDNLLDQIINHCECHHLAFLHLL